MDITYELKSNKKCFKAYEGEKEIGEVTFVRDGDTVLIIDHTYVNSDYRGRKIANCLVKCVIDLAKAENMKVVPLCPFAKKEFERYPEYKELLP